MHKSKNKSNIRNDWRKRMFTKLARRVTSETVKGMTAIKPSAIQETDALPLYIVIKPIT